MSVMYEYDIVEYEIQDIKTFEKYLDGRGRNGERLVSALRKYPSDRSVILVFERECGA